MRAGVVASAVLAPHMKKGHKPPAPHEFVLFDLEKASKLDPVAESQSVEEMKRIAAEVKLAFEGPQPWPAEHPTKGEA